MSLSVSSNSTAAPVFAGAGNVEPGQVVHCWLWPTGRGRRGALTGLATSAEVLGVEEPLGKQPVPDRARVVASVMLTL